MCVCLRVCVCVCVRVGVRVLVYACTCFVRVLCTCVCVCVWVVNMGGIISSSSTSRGGGGGRSGVVSLSSNAGLKYVRSNSIGQTKSPPHSPNTAHRKMIEKTHNSAQARTEREARILIAQGKADRNLMSTESILFGQGNAFQRRRSLTMAESMNDVDENGNVKSRSPEMYGTTRAGRKTQQLVEASRRRRLNSVGDLEIATGEKKSREIFITPSIIQKNLEKGGNKKKRAQNKSVKN